MNTEIHFAPLQDYTDFEFRNIHAKHCPGVNTYYTPFIRWEKIGIREKDVKDILPENNMGVHLIPQIICSNTEEFNRIADAIQRLGYEEMDLNMGCPAPMQTKLQRGSGMLPHPDLVQTLIAEMEKRKEVRFSIKMRLGFESNSEWRELASMLNESQLQHITMHPRIGKQMYKGEVDIIAFEEFYNAVHIPIIYNGDISHREDIERIATSYPNIKGVMIGRDLLARPSLAQEYLNREDLPAHERHRQILAMHEDMLEFCTRKYKVDSQILLHIHAFWEYQENNIGRKSWKKIMKAGSMKNYIEAVNNINI